MPQTGSTQHDVVDDRLERDRLGDDPGDGRGTGRCDEVRPAAPDLDELGQDREGDLLGGLGADVEAGRCSQRGDPVVADRRLLAQPLAHDAGTCRRRDEAHVGHVTREREPDRLLVPDPLARDDDIRRCIGVETADVGRGVDAFRGRERLRVGDGVDDGHPPAGGRAE